MTTYCLRLTPGQELKEELDAMTREQSWSAACILTGIGSLSKAAIRFAGVETAKILEGPFEILSLSGTLSPAGSHLHITIADSEGRTMGGHLKEGAIIRTTGEIVIGILTDWEFSREQDPQTGFPELTVKRQSN